MVAVETEKESTEDRQLLARVREFGFDEDESTSWLGRYVRIRDGIAGNIILNRSNLARFVRCAQSELVRRGHGYDSEIRNATPYYLVWATYAHEQFHFICDLARNGAPPGVFHEDRLLEEALATAWSRRCMLCKGEGTPGLKELVDWKFDWITAPGYRDWKKYENASVLRKVASWYADLIHFPEYLDHNLVPTARAASWCNYWIGGESALADRARGRRGNLRFFDAELHADILC